MADITAADVTVTVGERVSLSGSGKKLHFVTMAFGDGALVYGTAHVPMPSHGTFGFKRQLDTIILTDQNPANGFVYKYDQANKKIRIYQGDNNNASDAPLIELVVDTATPAATTLKGLALGW